MVFNRGESLPTEKVSWKPLRSLPLVTCTDCRACITTLGAGTGTAGPIISVRWTPLSIRRSGNSFGQRDPDLRARASGQLFWLQHGVWVRDTPVLLGVAEILVCDQIGAFSLQNGMQFE